MDATCSVGESTYMSSTLMLDKGRRSGTFCQDLCMTVDNIHEEEHLETGEADDAHSLRDCEEAGAAKVGEVVPSSYGVDDRVYYEYAADGQYTSECKCST